MVLKNDPLAGETLEEHKRRRRHQHLPIQLLTDTYVDSLWFTWYWDRRLKEWHMKHSRHSQRGLKHLV